MKKFMDKIMKLFGYKKPVLDWNDFNNEIQMLILKRTAFAFLLILCFIIFSIITNTVLFYIISLLLIFASALTPLFLLYDFRCDRINIVEGACTDINKSSSKGILGMKYGKSSITVEDNTNIYTVPVPHYSMFAKNKEVRIYFRQHEVYKRTDILYNIYNPVLVIPLHSIDS